MIFVPNLLFLIFLGLRFNRARLKLRATSSPIFLTFYGIVWACVLMSVLRCLVSMLVNAATSFGGMTDKVSPDQFHFSPSALRLLFLFLQIMWIAVRFSLLSAEMSVVIFGLAFGEFFFIFCPFGLFNFTDFFARAPHLRQNWCTVDCTNALFRVFVLTFTRISRKYEKTGLQWSSFD